VQPPMAVAGQALVIGGRAHRTATPYVEIHTAEEGGAWRQCAVLILGETPTDTDFRELGRIVWLSVR
jgi:hypothetical protein